MRDLLLLYPRFLLFSGIMAVFLLIVAMVPGFGEADATAIDNPFQSTAADTRKVSAGDCRFDQHAYSSTCLVHGRAVRVINF